MKLTRKQSFGQMVLPAMIIALLLVLPAHAQQDANLPSPVAFATRMELGDLDAANRWLDAGMPPDFMGSRIGSGLMIGAWEGKFALMELFLARGADINRMNGNGETALALAAWRGNSDVVRWLLAHGAKVNAPEKQWSALHYAVFAGHADLSDYLIEQGADINAQTTNGSSVLMTAVYEGREALARKLIEKGADRTVRNDWGDGALEWAMRYNRLDLARMVSNPEEFNVAVSKPKESWGEAKRSQRSSKELEQLLAMREKIVERGGSTASIDARIAAERVRIVRSEMDRQKTPVRAVALEITAKRKQPQEQSAKIVDDDGNKGAFKAPAASYFGTPKMPPKGNVKGY